MSQFALLHRDRMKIFRQRSYEVRGITREELEIAYEEIPCKLSRNKKAIFNSLAPEIINTYIIFCSPSTDLIEGDFVTIESNGKMFSLLIGEVAVYNDTIQAIATRRELM